MTLIITVVRDKPLNSGVKTKFGLKKHRSIALRKKRFDIWNHFRRVSRM